MRHFHLLLPLIPVRAFHTLKEWQVPFVNNVKYLGVIFYKKNYMEITYTNDRR